MNSRWLILWFMVTFQSLNAQIVLKGEGDEYSITQLKYFRSPHTVGINEVYAKEFLPLTLKNSRSLGFDSAEHWFEFQVVNKSNTNDWLLEVAYAPLDHVELFYPDSSGKWQSLFFGDSYPLSKRIIKHRHVIFPLSIPRLVKTTYYLKIKTISSVQVPLTLWKNTAFHQRNYDTQFAHGIFYGIMIVMIFYNLFLYFSIGDKTIFFYILTLISGTNVIAFFQGYGFYFLTPERPDLNLYFSAFSGPFFILCSVMLTRSFLNLKTFSRYLDQTLVANALVAMGAGASSVFFPGSISYEGLHLLTVLNFVLIFAAAIYCFYRNYRPARYFLLAWVSLLIVGIMFTIRNMGIIQSNWFSNNALYFGGIMQTLLISFALGDRIKILEQENKETRERQLQLEQENTIRLEKEVAQRTQEILIKKDELEKTNSIKDKLFSMISHDLRGPLNSLKGIMNVFKMGGLSQQEFEKLAQNINQQLHLTSDLLDNLLQWSKSQLKGYRVQAEAFSINKMVKGVNELLGFEFQKKEITYSIKAKEECFAFADPSMINTVIRNLISNAIKFTNPGGIVEIIISNQENQVVVSIKDSGVGIAHDQLAHLFTLQSVITAGTKAEKGTGIGLVLCKDFVEANKGTLAVNSIPGHGAVFKFTLPAAGATL